MKRKEYHFYGGDNPELHDVHPVRQSDSFVRDPFGLYDLLRNCWSRETCTPRLRDQWDPSDPTVGQCAITAFLAQDIFGGKVYGVPRENGNFHCYNEVNGIVFDLTSEQFGEERLDYRNNPEQFRDIHFLRAEKKERYEKLKTELQKYAE